MKMKASALAGACTALGVCVLSLSVARPRFMAASLASAVGQTSRQLQPKPMSPTGITGLAQTGCGQCHVSSDYVVPSFSGPSTVGAGLPGSFSIATQLTRACGLIDNPCRVGIDVASSDAQGLATNDIGIQLLNNEITHTGSYDATKSIAQNQTGTVTYNFKYTMPNLAPGTVRTLYGSSRVGGDGWHKATNFVLAVPLGSSQPSSASLAFTPNTYSMTVSWNGSGTAAAYQVAVKPYPNCATLPSQSIVNIPVTTNHSALVTGLSASTNYCFSVWGASEAAVGGNSKQFVYSDSYASGNASTSAIPPPVAYPFLITGRLGTARFNHTATLLPTGKVLIAGGKDATTTFQSAELYDPRDGTFSNTGSMSAARSGHTATSLPNGKVLITGGSASNAAAELYDPYTGTFSTTGMMSTVRTGHTATLLLGGKVLVAGGTTSVSSADLYDPSSGTFTPTGNLTTARFDHSATLLTNGKVLLAGGSATAGGTALATAEIYDPAGNSFSATANNLTNARKNHTATSGPQSDPNGLVYLVGGFDIGGTPLLSRELYRTSDNSFVGNDTSPYATAKHTSTLLPNGGVLITGGVASDGTSLDKVRFLGDATADITLTEPRQSHTATLLADGRVLITGGRDSATGNAIGSAEFYDPTVYLRAFPRLVLGQMQQTLNMTSGRNSHKATLLANGKVLISGGYSQTSNPIPGCFVYEWNTAELFDPSSGTFAATTGNMNGYRAEHTATLLPNGKVLIAGGYWDCSTNALNTAELYDPTANTFTPTGNLNTARWQHTATLLANGKVLIAGGNTGNATAAAELYDPNSGTFTATGNLVHARRNHTATLLPNGKVLIAGGSDFVTGTLDTSELYDPVAGTFSDINIAYYKTYVQREQHTATLLSTGKVLIANGVNGGSTVAGAMLYDPATNDYYFSSCCQTPNGRAGATATLLPDGRVVMIGGGDATGKIDSVEVWDPANSSLFASDKVVLKRSLHTATLLPSGYVLITGGVGVTLADGTDSTAELFKLPAPSAPPAITTAPTAVFLPTNLILTGTGFRHDTEAHSGNAQSSPADLPILRLQRVDNDQISFVRPSSRNATSFSSAVLTDLADGHYRATIITDGVPSAQNLIAVRTVVLTAPTVSAAASSITSVAVSWSSVNGAASYEVLRTEDHINYISRGTTAGTTFADSAQSGKSYLYKVRAFDVLNSNGPDSAPELATTVIFTDDPIAAGVTRAKRLHITELRTAVDAVRTLAGLTGGTYAETITAGSTTIKASHIVELRSSLNQARTILGISSITYSDPALTSGMTIKAVHINDLRIGVK